MLHKETKTNLILLVVLSFFCASQVLATDYTSSNFQVNNPVIDTGSNSSTSANYGLGQSTSQAAIGKSTSTNFQLWSGFQYFFKVNANVLTATPGDTQVSLSWTVPQTFLGIGVSSYEVGVGTVSGSYVFTDRGNVTNYIQTGLTNGTQYYFKIKAKALGGIILTFSNEATATPNGAVTPPPPPPGGGGGGGGGGTATLILKGLAYPGSQVSVLKDGSLTVVSTADPGAAFNITLSNLAAGAFNISVYATDPSGFRSPSYSVPVMMTGSTTVTIDNIFLGPSIGVSAAEIKKGETLNIFGFTAPNVPVSVFVHSDPIMSNVTSGGNGAWFKAFNTAVLDLGGHDTQSQAQKDNLISAYSNTVAFTVGDKTVPSTGNCRRSDLNCDGFVNLTDFSILLFFWQKTNPSNAKADINSSGSVDLTDFSILLFDWTG